MKKVVSFRILNHPWNIRCINKSQWSGLNHVNNDAESLLNKIPSQSQQLVIQRKITQITVSSRLYTTIKMLKEGRWVPHRLTEDHDGQPSWSNHYLAFFEFFSPNGNRRSKNGPIAIIPSARNCLHRQQNAIFMVLSYSSASGGMRRMVLCYSFLPSDFQTAIILFGEDAWREIFSFSNETT